MKPEVKEKINDSGVSGNGGAMNSLVSNNKKSLTVMEASLAQKGVLTFKIV